MILLDTSVNYREFRLSKIFKPEYRHILFLIYWPFYGIMFLFVERFYPVDHYFPVYCVLDDMIPFCEFFLIPYLFWFVLLAGLIVFTFFYDVESCRRMMTFIIITYSFTIIIYLLFPTCQHLRPASFERSNIFTRFLFYFYNYDTNTNVCPSIHVIGSFASLFTAWHTKYLDRVPIRIAFAVTTALICVSTMFLKQHSIIDVIAGAAVSFAAYFICFRQKRKAENTSPV